MLNVSHLRKWKCSEGLNKLLKVIYLGRIGVFLLHLPGPGPLQLLSGKIKQELRDKRFQKHPRISYPLVAKWEHRQEALSKLPSCPGQACFSWLCSRWTPQGVLLGLLRNTYRAVVPARGWSKSWEAGQDQTAALPCVTWISWRMGEEDHRGPEGETQLVILFWAVTPDLKDGR